jgi:hypothetical protein
MTITLMNRVSQVIHKVYFGRCRASFFRVRLDEYNGAALSKRSETVDDTVQLEAADLATAEAQGLEIGPCSATMQAWCTTRHMLPSGSWVASNTSTRSAWQSVLLLTSPRDLRWPTSMMT